MITNNYNNNNIEHFLFVVDMAGKLCIGSINYTLLSHYNYNLTKQLTVRTYDFKIIINMFTKRVHKR